MKIKGIVFDIGQTLVYYPIPLNWSALYRPAFESIAKKLGLDISEDEYTHIGNTLAKYNTRINPREKEVSSGTIFREILEGTRIPMADLDAVKQAFYSFFRNDVRVYEEVPETLKALKAKGIMTGTLSDVPYGMDNEFAFADIAEVIEYIDIPFTSNDAGYRKPHPKGLEMLAAKMNILPPEMIFVGDERKDIECARNAGATAVLINRDAEEKDFGQDYTIKSMKELTDILAAEDRTELTMHPVGRVRNQAAERKDCGWGDDVSAIVLDEPYISGLKGLEDFSHAVILFYLDKARYDREKHLQRRPQNREDMPLTGIFAQRAKDRPNRIGLTTVEILSVTEGTLVVKGLDAVDGTPVLDIKPYYPAYDKRDASVPEWVDRLMEHYF